MQVSRDVHSITRETLDSLRALGWTDQQMHDATQVIALFNYYTRLADALGVEPEDFMRKDAR